MKAKAQLRMVCDVPVFERELEDGRWLNVYPLTFGRARLGISKPAPHHMGGYEDVW